MTVYKYAVEIRPLPTPGNPSPKWTRIGHSATHARAKEAKAWEDQHYGKFHECRIVKLTPAI